MNPIIQTLMGVLWARLSETKDLYITYNFKYDSGGQDDRYSCEMRAGKPETCAVQIYEGTGNSFDEAFGNLRENIVYNKPLKSELG